MSLAAFNRCAIVVIWDRGGFATLHAVLSQSSVF